MSDPPSVVYGRSVRDGRWWALLPSAEVLRASRLGDLLDSVDRAMARQLPSRPFSFRLDTRGAQEPADSD